MSPYRGHTIRQRLMTSLAIIALAGCEQPTLDVPLLHPASTFDLDIPGDGRINCIAFSQVEGANQLVAATADHSSSDPGDAQVCVVDFETGRVGSSARLSGTPIDLSVSADGLVLAVALSVKSLASSDTQEYSLASTLEAGEIALFELPTLRSIGSISTDWVPLGICISPMGTSVAAIGNVADGRITFRTWELPGRKQIAVSEVSDRTISLQRDKPTRLLAFSGDGNRVFASTIKTTDSHARQGDKDELPPSSVVIFDAGTGATIDEASRLGTTRYVDVDESGEVVALSGSGNGGLFTIQPNSQLSSTGPSLGSSTVLLLGNGQQRVIVVYNDPSMSTSPTRIGMIANLNGALPAYWNVHEDLRGDEPRSIRQAMTVALSHDRRWLAVSDTNRVVVWQVSPP
jgi:hypothetical protein